MAGFTDKGYECRCILAGYTGELCATGTVHCTFRIKTFTISHFSPLSITFTNIGTTSDTITHVIISTTIITLTTIKPLPPFSPAPQQTQRISSTNIFWRPSRNYWRHHNPGYRYISNVVNIATTKPYNTTYISLKSTKQNWTNDYCHHPRRWTISGSLISQKRKISVQIESWNGPQHPQTSNAILCQRITNSSYQNTCHHQHQHHYQRSSTLVSKINHRYRHFLFNANCCDIIFPLFLATDIDECSASHQCHTDASCTNTQGSYKCSCKEGFTGNGFGCTGKPTKATGAKQVDRCQCLMCDAVKPCCQTEKWL